MAATVTVTGSTGPGVVLTAVVYTFVKRFTIDAEKNMLSMILSTDQYFEVSVTAATTVTATKSGVNWTLVIS